MYYCAADNKFSYLLLKHLHTQIYQEQNSLCDALYLRLASPSVSSVTETVFQSLGSTSQEHKNNNAYPTNRHIPSVVLNSINKAINFDTPHQYYKDAASFFSKDNSNGFSSLVFMYKATSCTSMDVFS